MIELRLWHSGEDFDEDPLRGVRAVKKFWGMDVVKAYVEFGGLNFDRGYHYQVFVCFERRDEVRDIVRKVIKLGPGSIKWIDLLLYKQDEKSACEELKKGYDFNEFRESIRKNEEKAKELTTRLARVHLKSRINSKKDVIPEYLLSVGYLIQRNGCRALVYVI